MNAEKRWMVVSKETGISVEYFASRSQAEKKAREMTEYHQRSYIVVERRS